MTLDTPLKLEQCNCLAIRQASRHMTQLYDKFLAPAGLRTTQFSILATLRTRGPLSINALAEQMVMDRTTLGRNIQPLEREELIETVRGKSDRRVKELHLTKAGLARLRVAGSGWAEAQARFEEVFGRKRSADLRELLRNVASSEL